MALLASQTHSFEATQIHEHTNTRTHEHTNARTHEHTNEPNERNENTWVIIIKYDDKQVIMKEGKEERIGIDRLIDRNMEGNTMRVFSLKIIV